MPELFMISKSSVKSNRSKAETVYDTAEFDTQSKVKGNPPFSVIHESPDEFIDHSDEGKGANLGIKTLCFETRS